MAALARLLDLVYPPECACCRAPTASSRGLCPACFGSTAFITGATCTACGIPLATAGPDVGARCEPCTTHPPAWDRGRAAVLYEGAAREVILRFKHADRLDLAPVLARWLTRAAGPLLAQADIVAPVPLHWTRLIRRRANQAAELVRSPALVTAATRAPTLLRRIRPTAQLKGTGRDARHRILADAIALSPGADVSNRRILLIDDVMTTGATLSACAEAVRAGGATAVDVLVVARVAREDFAPMFRA